MTTDNKKKTERVFVFEGLSHDLFGILDTPRARLNLHVKVGITVVPVLPVLLIYRLNLRG